MAFSLQVWKLHGRIKFYIVLTIIAVMVDLSIGIGGIVYVLHYHLKPPLIAATWTARHVHIALDTLVLYSALSDTVRVGVDNGQMASSRNGRGGGVCASKRTNSDDSSSSVAIV